MIHCLFSFPNLYKMEDFAFDVVQVPKVGEVMIVGDEKFVVLEVEWTVSNTRKYVGGVVVHLIKKRGHGLEGGEA